jgi:exopolysaccharide production protein ExoQ
VGNTENVKSSLGLWVPFIWFFFVSTRSLTRWIYSTKDVILPNDDMGVGGLEDRVLLVTLICVGMCILGARVRLVIDILRRNKWVLALFVYMGLSIIWSNFEDDSQRRWIRSVGTLIMVLVVLTEPSPLESISALLRRCYFIVLPLSIVSIKYFRGIGVAYDYTGNTEMWVGLTNHKNNLGQVAMSSGLFYCWSIFRKWRRITIVLDLLLVLMSVWLLRGSGTSQSTTALVGFGLSVILLLGLDYVKKNTIFVSQYAIVGVLVVVCSAGLIELTVEALFESTLSSVSLTAMGRDETLTGRTGLWNDILANASKQPLLGVGFGAFWVGPIGYDLYPLSNWSKVTPGWRPNQGHNGYLDVYVELGLVGIMLLSGVIVTAFKHVLKQMTTDFDYAKLRVVYLIIILLNNITESSFLKGTHSLWFLFLLFAINVRSVSHSTSPASRCSSTGTASHAKQT